MLVVSKKNNRETAKQYAMRTLLYNLINLHLKPGEKIIESDLCEQLDISRTPIREALLELKQKQMIDILPKQGTYVSLVDADAINDFIELRALLEGELVQIACDMFADEDIQYLKENVSMWESYAEAENSVKMQEYDKEFHNYIYRRCNRSLWLEIITTNSYQFDRIIILMQNSQMTDFLVSDHNSIIAAIEARDKRTAKAVTIKHITRFYDKKVSIRNFYPQYFK